MAAETADWVAFVGSIKWRESRPFGPDDLAALLRHRDAVPGADHQTATVAVTRTGAAVDGVTAFGT